MLAKGQVAQGYLPFFYLDLIPLEPPLSSVEVQPIESIADDRERRNTSMKCHGLTNS